MMKFLKRHVKVDDEGNIIGNLNAVQMDGLVKQLDALYNSQTDPFSPATDKILRSQIAGLRNSIKKQLNRIPGYKAINDLYSSTTSAKNSYDVGVKVVTKDVQDWSALESMMREMSDTDMIALMDGVKWSLVNILKEAGNDPTVATRLFNSEVLRGKLAAVFGGTTTDALLDSARSAAKFAETEGLMNVARGQGLTGQQRNPIEKAMDIGIAGLGLGTPVISSAAGVGAGRRVGADLPGAGARQAQAFSDLVSKSGPEAEALLGGVLPKVQSGPRPLDPTDLLSSGLGAFGAKALPGERRDTSFGF